jgi:hypothetical protein
MSRARSPLYPYLVAVTFPLGLAVANLEELPGPMAALVVFGFALLVTAAIDVAARLVIRDATRRGLIVTVLLSFALGYGHADAMFHEHVYNLVLMPSLFAGLVLPLAWIVLRVKNPERLASFVRTMAVALLCLQLFPLAQHLVAQAGVKREEAARITVDGAGSLLPGGKKPDVYLLVFDAYARADVLQEHYDHDNRGFLDALRERGFYVADQARSNYIHTRISLPSILNMRYLDPEIQKIGTGADKTATEPLLRRFEIARRMQALGYTYRHVGGFWHVTRENAMADENVFYMPSFAEEFMFVFLRTTMFDPVVRAIPAYREFFHPGLVHLQQLASVPKPADRKGPVFTFAHVMCPHPPFAFNRKGLRKGADTDLHGGTRAGAYADQLVFLNQRIIELVDEIDRASGRDAIILIHGDHGGRALGQRWHGRPELINEQTAILAAYRFPPQAAERLYPTITPVNNFRLLLSSVFGVKDLPMLEDRSFYSDPDRIFELEEIDWKTGVPMKAGASQPAATTASR